MPDNIIVLANWKKARDRGAKRVRSPPSSWNLKNPADIPPNKKGIVSGYVLSCPLCGGRCFYTKPIGRGSKTWLALKPICGFSCKWSGEMHLCNGDPLSCPGCAQHPRGWKEK